jgi:hypothetical protein
VLTKTISTVARALVLATIVILGLANQSHAGDNLEISPVDYKKAEAMIKHWLSLVDKGKYAESFAAASESFRKNLSAEKWAANHPKMLAETGPVDSRGEISSFTTKEKANNQTLPSSYQVEFKTKFKKKSGTEHLEIVKENGEWKVADYLIIPE